MEREFDDDSKETGGGYEVDASVNSDVTKVQPKYTFLAVPKGKTSSERLSFKRLKELDFDPMGELVHKYKKLEAELTYQELIREGRITEYTTSGKAKAYNAERHMAIYDRLIAIGDKLLRYQYGRIPEKSIVDDKRRNPLTINLSKEGDTFQLNNEAKIEEAEYIDEEGVPEENPEDV